MFQLTFLWLGTFALLATVGAMVSRLDWFTRFMSALFGLVAWGVWTISSLEVSAVSNGALVSETYVELAALGAVATLLLLITTVQHAFAAFKDDSEAPNQSADFKVRP